MKPELRLDILQTLKDTLDIPLVLHGGSSNKDEEIAKAVKIGISKINIQVISKLHSMKNAEKY